MKRHLAARLDTFSQLIDSEMTSSNLISSVHASNPMPTWLLKTCASDLAHVPTIQCVTTFRCVPQFFKFNVSYADIEEDWPG